MAARPAYAGIAALVIAVVCMVPVASFYAVDHHEIGHRKEDAARDLEFRAGILRALVQQTTRVPALLSATQLYPLNEEVLASTADQILLSNLPVTSLSLTQADGPAFYYERQQKLGQPGQEPGTSSLQPLPVAGRLLALGEPRIALAGDDIVVNHIVELNIGSERQPWGIATATISPGALGQAAGFNELKGRGYTVTLDYVGRDAGSAKTLVSVGEDLRPDSLNYEVPLAGGDRLSMRASPPKDWDVPPILIPELAFVLCGGFLVGFLAYQLLRRPRQLRDEVAAHTSHLAEEKYALQSEIDVRKQAEQLLEESYALLDSIFEHIPSMIVLKRASDGRIVRINRAGKQIFGSSREFLLGRNNDELYPAEQAARYSQAEQEALSSSGMVQLPEEFIQSPGGAAHWVATKIIALNSGGERPDYVLELGEDVTERKHLDSALTEHIHFFEQLLAAMPSPMFFKGIDGRYIGVNKAFEEFYGLAAENIVGRTVFDITTPEQAAEFDAADRQLLESGGKQTYEATIKTASGQVRDVLFYKATFSSTHNETGGIVSVVLDISERKATERHVLQLNRTLAVLSETNQVILRTKECRKLIERAVHLLQNVGKFPLAWAYADHECLPDLLHTGEHGELIKAINARIVRDKGSNDIFIGGVDEVIEEGAVFHPTLAGYDPELAITAGEFGDLGLAHLPLRVAGKVVGGICILASSEEIDDPKEKSLLISLSDNLSFATDAIQQEQARQIAERKLQLASHVFENSAEGVMITDNSNKILMVNRRFSEITGFAAEEVIGNSPKLLSSGQQDESFYANMWRSLMNRGEWHGEIRNRRKDGEIIVEWLNISAVKNDAGVITNYVAVFSEITVHKQIKKRMQFLVHYDVLTSLPNRVLFSDRLEQTIISARRNKRMAALLFVDLDHFDDVNKALGHAAGDQLLQEVSARLLSAVPEGTSVARLGGDEFAIALSDIHSVEDAANAADRIQQILSRSIYIAETELSVSASIGISLYPKDGNDAEALTKCADAAMYQASEVGGNTYRFFNPNSNDLLSDRMKLRERLYRAIEREELRVFYQPIVSASTGRIVGAEALLRWFRPEAGFVSPQAFVPLLEESGLVVKVGDWVLRTALADTALWHKSHDRDLCISVNLSWVQFTDERSVDRIDSALKDLLFDPRMLQIEISESTVMKDAPIGLALLHRLKELGIRLSIDNFGTGYSSLSYLNRFPIDSIKIDRAFIQDSPSDAEAVAVTETIVAMSHALKLDIVAEGVETAGQVDFLRRIGCDTLQGYRFSQAVTADDFSQLLANRNGFDALLSRQDVAERIHLVR